MGVAVSSKTGLSRRKLRALSAIRASVNPHVVAVLVETAVDVGEGLVGLVNNAQVERLAVAQQFAPRSLPATSRPTRKTPGPEKPPSSRRPSTACIEKRR